MSRQYRSGTSLLLLVLVIAAVAAFATFVGPNLKSNFVADIAGGLPSAGTTSAALPPVAAPAPVTPPLATEHGIVAHIVDGDTLDVKLGGVRTRIRLLNVDTPETVKPDTPVECMGPQASARLAQLAPLGSTVGLAFDVERTDQYGRTLATVITPSGQNASEVLASEGLGVAVKYGQNTAGYAAIVVAQKHAQATKLGLYSGACG